MIAIQPMTARHDAYTYTVLGNGGEEQFVAIVTHMQDGRTAVKVVHVACDGRLEAPSNTAHVEHRRLVSHMRKKLLEWTQGNPDGVEDVIDQWRKTWL